LVTGRCHESRRSPVFTGGEELAMHIITKAHALNVIRRAYGPDYAESVRAKLPDRLDLENPADAKVLYDLGLTPDRLISALGAEY
jgi:hypothetical protein